MVSSFYTKLAKTARGDVQWGPVAPVIVLSGLHNIFLGPNDSWGIFDHGASVVLFWLGHCIHP